MSFGMWTRVGPSNYVLDWGADPEITKRERTLLRGHSGFPLLLSTIVAIGQPQKQWSVILNLKFPCDAAFSQSVMGWAVAKLLSNQLRSLIAQKYLVVTMLHNYINFQVVNC